MMPALFFVVFVVAGVCLLLGRLLPGPLVTFLGTFFLSFGIGFSIGNAAVRLLFSFFRKKRW